MAPETKGKEIISPDLSEIGSSKVKRASSAFSSIAVPARTCAIGAGAISIIEATLAPEDASSDLIIVRSVAVSPSNKSREAQPRSKSFARRVRGEPELSVSRMSCQSSPPAFSTTAQTWTATSPSAPIEAFHADFQIGAAST